jgi:hypothetical protein
MRAGPNRTQRSHMLEACGHFSNRMMRALSSDHTIAFSLRPCAITLDSHFHLVNVKTFY